MSLFYWSQGYMNKYVTTHITKPDRMHCEPGQILLPQLGPSACRHATLQRKTMVIFLVCVSFTSNSSASWILITAIHAKK